MWTRIKFGRYSANHGILLTGDGKGNFEYVPQYKSGLQLKGDVKSLAVVNAKKGYQVVAGINDAPAVIIKPGK